MRTKKLNQIAQEAAKYAVETLDIAWALVVKQARDEDGMYEYVLVTPMHGSDGFFVYKKTGEYVSSEY